MTAASQAPARQNRRGAMAGAEGFEPPLAVLETAGLPLNLRPFFSGRSLPVYHRPLLDLLVGMVLAAKRAELLELQPFRHGLLILHAGVILALAFRALK